MARKLRAKGGETAAECSPDLVEMPESPRLLVLPAPKSRRIDLRTLEQIRKEMSRVYRDSREGAIRPEDASRYSFQLQNIGKMVEALQFERRIAALEGGDDAAIAS